MANTKKLILLATFVSILIFSPLTLAATTETEVSPGLFQQNIDINTK